MVLFSELSLLGSGLHCSVSCTVSQVQREEDIRLALKGTFDFLDQFAALQIWFDVSDTKRLQRNRHAMRLLVSYLFVRNGTVIHHSARPSGAELQSAA